MNTLLFQSISAVSAIIVFVVWVKPELFPFLKDKDTQYPSLGRQGQYTALVVSTWIIVAESITRPVSEWLFTSYMFAWAGAQFASIWLKLKDQKTDKTP